MQVRFLDGPRKGQIARMEFHHAIPLINSGLVEAVFGPAARKPAVQAPEEFREPEIETAMVQPIAEQMINKKPGPRKK